MIKEYYYPCLDFFKRMFSSCWSILSFLEKAPLPFSLDISPCQFPYGIFIFIVVVII